MTLPGITEVGGKRWTGDLTEGFNPTNMNKSGPQGLVSHSPFGGLDIDIWPKRWNNAGTLETYPGVERHTLTANATNYVYLDGSQAPASQLTVSTSAFPTPATGQYFYLAEVVTNSTQVTGITLILQHSAVGAQANVQSVAATAPITNAGTSTNPNFGISDATPGNKGAMPAQDSDEGIWRQASGAFSLLDPGSDGDTLKVLSGALAWATVPDLKALLVARADVSVAAGSDVGLTSVFSLGDSSEFVLDPDGDNDAEIQVVNASRKCLLIPVFAGGGTQSSVELQKQEVAAESIGVLADSNAHACAIHPVSPAAGDYLKYRVVSGGLGSSTSQFVLLLIFGS